MAGARGSVSLRAESRCSQPCALPLNIGPRHTDPYFRTERQPLSRPRHGILARRNSRGTTGELPQPELLLILPGDGARPATRGTTRLAIQARFEAVFRSWNTRWTKWRRRHQALPWIQAGDQVMPRIALHYPVKNRQAPLPRTCLACGPPTVAVHFGLRSQCQRSPMIAMTTWRI